MDHEIRKLKMPDGSEVLIRPVTAKDAVKLADFIGIFSSDERMYMRFDSVEKEIIERQLNKPEALVINRIVAERNGVIIGEATLELMRHGWLRQSAEIKMVIVPEYRQSTLSETLAKEIFLLAAQRGIDRLVTRCIETQENLISVFVGLNFVNEASLPRHVVDDAGIRRNLVLLTIDISSLWQDIHDMISDSYTSMESVL